MRTRKRSSGFKSLYGTMDQTTSWEISSPFSVTDQQNSHLEHDFPMEVSSESFTDVVTPGYSRRRKEGAVVMNPFSQEVNQNPVASAHVSFEAERQSRALYGDSGSSSTFIQCVASVTTTYLYSTSPNPPATPPAKFAENGISFRLPSGALDIVSSVVGKVSMIVPSSALDRSATSGTIGNNTAEMTAVSDAALAQALARAHGSSIQGYVSVVELPETIRTIRNVMFKGFKLLRAFKKLDLKFIRGQLSATNLRSSWLEYRYGIRPIVADVRNALEAYDRLMRGRGERSRYRGQASEQEVTKVTEVCTLRPPFPATLRLQLQGQRTRVTSARATVLVDVTSEGSKLSDAAVILGGYEAIQSAWELIPYSFVVDWFINVGDWVSSWVPMVGASIVGSCVTTQVVTTEAINVESVSGIELPAPLMPRDTTFSPPASIAYVRPSETTTVQYHDPATSRVSTWVVRKDYSNTRVTRAVVTWSSPSDEATTGLSSGTLATTSMHRSRLVSPKKSLLPTIQIKLDTAKMVDLVALFTQAFGRKK